MAIRYDLGAACHPIPSPGDLYVELQDIHRRAFCANSIWCVGLGYYG
jgi:hypothetical protein